MLPAPPPDSSPTLPAASPSVGARVAGRPGVAPLPTASRPSRFESWPIVLAAGLLLYAFAVGWALLANWVRPDRTFLLMALPCLVPAAWCAYGYFRGERERTISTRGGERDPGLALSFAGWLLVAVAFLLKQLAVSAAVADANANALQATSPGVTGCAGLGILALLVGALFSWLYWNNAEDERNRT